MIAVVKDLYTHTHTSALTTEKTDVKEKTERFQKFKIHFDFLSKWGKKSESARTAWEKTEQIKLHSWHWMIKLTKLSIIEREWKSKQHGWKCNLKARSILFTIIALASFNAHWFRCIRTFSDNLQAFHLATEDFKLKWGIWFQMKHICAPLHSFSLILRRSDFT